MTKFLLFKVLALKEGELEWLSNHLGHDIQVHKDFYRLHDSTIEIAKVSKLLIAADQGQISTLQGKSLSEIDIEGKL